LLVKLNRASTADMTEQTIKAAQTKLAQCKKEPQIIPC